MTQDEYKALVAETEGHTPGPWKIASGCDQYVCSDNKWLFSTMGVTGANGAINARLIAAAPALLEVVGRQFEAIEWLASQLVEARATLAAIILKGDAP